MRLEYPSRHFRLLHWSKWNQKITARNGVSFYFASFILGRAQRQRAYQIYALCRIIDDATDENQLLNSEQISEADSDAQLSLHHSGSKLSDLLLHSLFSGQPIADSLLLKNPHFLGELKRVICRALGISHEQVASSDLVAYLDLMSDELKAMRLEKAHIAALVSGQKTDENFQQPQNFQEFYNYCYLVAGVVGLLMAKVFGAKEDLQTLRAAEHLGIAMQITNILRDIKEDHEQKHRVYIPKDVAQMFGCNITALMEERAANDSPEFAQVVLEMARWGMTFYQSALSGVSGIPSFRARVCVKAMAAIYSAILVQIHLFPFRPLNERIVVSRFKKAGLFLGVLFGRAPLAAAGFDLHSLRLASRTGVSKLEAKAIFASASCSTLKTSN